MKERLRAIQSAFHTAKVFAADVVRHSPSKKVTTGYWDEMSENKFRKLVSHLSNPFDDERQFIKEELENYGVSSVLDAGSGPSIDFAVYGYSENLNQYTGLDRSERMITTA